MNPALRTALLCPSRAVVALHDFRIGMPAGATYARTGAATGLTLSGSIASFAADAPQRTDRGLTLEPARTNLIQRCRDFNDAVWSRSSGATVTANTALAPDGTTTADAVTDPNTAYAYVSQGSAIAAGAYRASVFVKKQAGHLALQFSTASGLGGYFDTQTGEAWMQGVSLSGAGTVDHGDYLRLWIAASLASSTYGIWCYPAIGRPANASAVGASVVWGAQFEAGTTVSSPILTAGAAGTRGLPTFTEPVPSGRTGALLTYADGTSALVSGLTPGGIFDIASAVIGAGKGAFGASELVTREWRT